MKNKVSIIVFTFFIIIAIIFILLLYIKNLNESKSLSEISQNQIQEVDWNLLKDKKIDIDINKYNFREETNITLSNEKIIVSGNGAIVKSIGEVETVEIVSEGAYRISGSIDNARIVVNSKDSDINLILDNVKITCVSSAPIYIYKANSTMITLAENSTNILNDGEVYNLNDEYSSIMEEEPNSCLYSKSDLILYGNGKLIVNAKSNNGITSKDRLYIEDADILVNAKNHGINGKDCNMIINSILNISTSGDGVRSTNNEDDNLGWIRIEESDVKINSNEDGIQAESDLIILGGIVGVISGEGSENTKINNDFNRSLSFVEDMNTENEISRKGIKATQNILLEAVEMKIDSFDDAIHSNESIRIVSGKYVLKTSDDGIHADGTIIIDNGNIQVLNSYEGIEASNIVLNNGEINIISSDDGININGGNDFSGLGNFDRIFRKKKDMKFSGDMKSGNILIKPNELINTKGEKSGNTINLAERKKFKEQNRNMENKFTSPTNDGNFEQPSAFFGENSKSNDIENVLLINGGNIVVNAAGDGLDSNGKINMFGGNVIIYGPTNSENGALDYASTFEISGGTLIALGTSGMAQSTSNSSIQPSIYTNIEKQNENSKIILKDSDGNEIVSCISPKTFSNLVISSDKLSEKETYYIYINNEKVTEVMPNTKTSFVGRRSKC